MGFPKDFIWGAATSAIQVEGAADTDGRGKSVWDIFCSMPGRIYQGHNFKISSDQYNHYKEDVALMKNMGLQAYRFSISWPRILPEGRGKINQKGIDYYERLVNELLASQIFPYITLFHWDYPYDLYLRGGWLNPDSPNWFADYVKVVVERLSDRVKQWITLNEPQVFVGCGHGSGVHAPGTRLSFPELIKIGHHALLAHGKAVQTIRAYSKQTCEVGYAPVGVVKIPADDSPKCIEAARQAMFSFNKDDFWCNTWWYDPVFFGNYPEDMIQLYKKELSAIRPEDLEIINQPLDFLGANIYHGSLVRAHSGGKAQEVPWSEDTPLTAFGWPVTPQSLYWGPRFLYERYKKPIFITENGMSNIDWPSVDGKVHDSQRIDFTTRYLREYARAAADGVDIRGYLHWSLMDNFEWAQGFKERFGLIYVEYATGKRIMKDSAFWYRDVISTNGEKLF